ncbi:FadD3 family acyl-CoA ligase [Gordonia sp. CPCC 206044]|uniref:FadD3 family acyl-CoA ligase n=1 Tax=Gordonia sp. CPCC 206044 TaxID=3140793 RepID=UPI003AF33943
MTWQTIPEMVLSAGDRFGDSEAVVDGSRRLTFREITDRILRAAGAFHRFGIVKGDRVAIWAPNSADWIIAAFGLLTAGATLVPINTRYKQAEADDILVRSSARLLLVQKGFLGQDFTPSTTVPVIDLSSGFLDDGEPFQAELDGTDIADVMFTSGTTGRPKGVMTNHRQTLRLFSEWCDLADLRTGDRYLIVNPFFHMFGYKAGMIAAFIRGATIYPVPVFDVDAVLTIVADEQITMLPGPPTLYQSLLSADRSTWDLSSLRAAVTGSADIPVELIRRMHEELPFETIMTGYGLSEGGTVTASRRGDTFEQIAATVGTPCADIEIAIADDGEVLIRGYNVMQGYLDDPDATAEAIDPAGWLHTGDLGAFDDDGHLRIIGRKKDMFIVGGFNAYPAEIESYLLDHPAVAQVAVIGVPDERLGQVGKAFVVAAAEVTEDEILDFARERMAGFKAPRSVVFLDELPLTATGKVHKDLLRRR